MLAGYEKTSSGVHFTFVFFLKPSSALGLAFFWQIFEGDKRRFLKTPPHQVRQPIK
jgi:hypothetical protein